jgi:nucleoside-diphosphate kinase
MSRVERTLSIVKPDAVARGKTGEIVARIEASGLRLVALRLVRLSRAEAEGFYHVHRARPFFSSLTGFMSSGPSVPMVLEADNAIQRLRDLMGPTDPAQAAEGTIRRLFGTNIERNAIHGSDSAESAAFEVGYFFRGLELGGPAE